MSQLDFSFLVEGGDPHQGRKEAFPPVNGSSRLTRDSSHSGAVHACEARSANLTMLRQLWREPLTMNEVSTISGLPLSSVCSLKSALGDEIEEVDQVIVVWASGRPTKRTRWRLKR